MKPIKFNASNATLQHPSCWRPTAEECSPLPVHRDGEHIISCWRPTVRECLQLLWHRELWLWVWSITSQPPVAVGTTYPFNDRNKKEA